VDVAPGANVMVVAVMDVVVALEDVFVGHGPSHDLEMPRTYMVF